MIRLSFFGYGIVVNNDPNYSINREPGALAHKNQQQLEALLARLYALGELGSGEGAKLLGLTRREFFDLLNQYNVSLFDDTIDFKKEAGYK